MKYKELYKELAQHLTELKISICDHDLYGYCYDTKKIKAFIVIKSDMDYKSKYFTLCHEAGHLFYMKKGQKFVWSKNTRSEEEANWFTLQLLKSNEIDLNEYREFYKKAKKMVKKRKKSWFEI